MNFRDCTLQKLDKTFGLEVVKRMPILMTWLASQTEISEHEQIFLEDLQEGLIDHVHDWNETELVMGFIGPLVRLVNFSEEKFNFFAQRTFAGKVDDMVLSGKPDGLIASGKREPEKPYFCFQEYKRENDPEGDPAGQALAAMLVAQELNEHEHPIYGCYVKGDTWYFMVLEGRKYSISPGYMATTEKIFEIFSILRGLKPIIRGLIKSEKKSATE